MCKLIAHRGLKTKYKENTLEAFKSAINSNYIGFECDIRQTKDRKLIIYHDSLYKGKLIRLLNYNQFDNILLLEDVLKLNTSKIILLDIKDPLLDVDLLNDYIKNNKNIYVISFHNNIINKLNKIKKEYKVGLLNYLLNSNSYEKTYDFICLLHLLVDDKLINLYKNNNKLLFIYGVNSKIEYNKYPYYIVD